MQMLPRATFFGLAFSITLLTGCPRDALTGAVAVTHPGGTVYVTVETKLYKCSPSGADCTPSDTFPSAVSAAVYSDSDARWWVITEDRTLQSCATASKCNAIKSEDMPKSFGVPVSLAVGSAAVFVTSDTGNLARCIGTKCELAWAESAQKKE